jgi:hypothetical protein
LKTRSAALAKSLVANANRQTRARSMCEIMISADEVKLTLNKSS